MFWATFKYFVCDIDVMARTFCKTKTGKIRKILKSGKCPAGTRKVKVTKKRVKKRTKKRVSKRVSKKSRSSKNKRG